MVLLITSKPNTLSLTKIDNIRTDGFLGGRGSPALGTVGSRGRESVKVVPDKKVEPTEFFVKSGSPGTSRSVNFTIEPFEGLIGY